MNVWVIVFFVKKLYVSYHTKTNWQKDAVCFTDYFTLIQSLRQKALCGKYFSYIICIILLLLLLLMLLMVSRFGNVETGNKSYQDRNMRLLDVI